MTTETVEVFEPPTPSQGTDAKPENPPAPPTPTAEAPTEQVDAVLDAIMSRIRPVAEAPLYAKFLIYGPPGAGKTKLCGEAEDALVVDIEKGARTLLNHSTTIHAKVMEYRSLVQLNKLLDYIEAGKITCGTLVIDSGSTLAERALDEIVKEESRKDAGRNPFVPQLQDYNANTNHMRRVMDRLRNLPTNVAVIAQAKEVKDESTGVLHMRPNFTDKLGGSLNHLFDTIGYLTIDDQGVRQLQVAHTNKVTAKTRIGNLPPVIKNPNINDLIRSNAATPA